MSTPPFSTTDLPPELARAAQWLQAHSSEAAMVSMRESARRAGLKPATFTRLAQYWGYDGFDALKRRLQLDLARRAVESKSAGYVEKALALQAAAARGPAWLAELNQAQHANTQSVLRLNAGDALMAAADAMLAAEGCWFFGLRSAYGLVFHMAYSYALVADNGHLVHGEGGFAADQLVQLGPRDLLVFISLAPYSRETVGAVRAAMATGVPVLGITDDGFPFGGRTPAHRLRFETDGPSFFHSMVGGLALAEQLVATAAARGGARALARMRARQQALHAQGAYRPDKELAAGKRRSASANRA